MPKKAGTCWNCGKPTTNPTMNYCRPCLFRELQRLLPKIKFVKEDGTETQYPEESVAFTGATNEEVAQAFKKLCPSPYYAQLSPKEIALLATQIGQCRGPKPMKLPQNIMGWDKEGRPTFEVKRINDAQVAFRCPKCKRENIHGSPIHDRADGHRVSHCDCWPKGYYIKETP